MKRSIGLALLLLSAAGVPAQEGDAPAAQTVRVSRVFDAEDNQQRRYTGLIVSPAVINLVSRVAGEIVEVHFRDGSAVEEGQVLFRIDPVQYEAAVKAAEAQVAQCRAELEYAQSYYNRISRLEKSNAVSKDVLESSLRSMQVCEAGLLAAEAALIAAKDHLKNTVVVSPISGTIGVTNFTRGNYVSPDSGVLAKVIQTDPVRVRFSVSTRDFLSAFGTAKEFSDNVSIRLRLADNSSYPEEGEVELINNEANQNTDTLQVYAQFGNPDLKLFPGSTVTVILSRKKPLRAPAVLPSALMRDRDSAYVYVLDAADRVEKRPVVAGNATAAAQFILSGVEVGERVVSDGNHKVMPGDAVNPVE